MIALILALAALLHSQTGVASYYADPKAAQGSHYAAVPGFHWGDKPYYVWVHRFGKDLPRVRVLVQDSCGCLRHNGNVKDDRLIDLSWHAFGILAPLSKGLVKVVVER